MTNDTFTIALTKRTEARNLSAGVTTTPVSVAEEIALSDAGSRRSDAGLRRLVAGSIVVAFLVVNGAVLLGIWMLFKQDNEHLLRAGSNFLPADRLVTTNLLMTLVTATTVQLGALIVLIGKYLFPAPRDGG